MDAQELLSNLVEELELYVGHKDFDCQPPFWTPRHVGPFGATFTNRYTQAVMIKGEKFFITVEKDPNQ